MWRLGVLCAASCGRIGFDPRDDADATPPAWSPPIMVGELAGANGDDDPTLPADMLEIYFNSD